MKKSLKPDVICDKCGSILEYEHWEFYCDVCNKKLVSGEKPIMISSATGAGWDTAFCSFSCARAWLLEHSKKSKQLTLNRAPYGEEIFELIKGSAGSSDS